MESFDSFLDCGRISKQIEPTFGCYLFTLLRNQRGLMGMRIAANADDLRSAGEFEIQFDMDGLFKNTNVAILDVPSIFPKVNSDRIGSTQLGQRCCHDRIRFVRSSSLPYGRDMVNVDA
jgi:hypothetical protein